MSPEPDESAANRPVPPVTPPSTNGGAGDDRWAPPSGPLVPPSAAPDPAASRPAPPAAPPLFGAPAAPGSPAPSGPPSSPPPYPGSSHPAPPAAPVAPVGPGGAEPPLTLFPGSFEPIPPAPTSSHRARRATWLPVAALALVVGLAGGFLGSALQNGFGGSDDPPGLAGGGLADVDLTDLPPLKAPGSVAEVAQAVLPSTVQILAEYDGQDAGATGSGWVLDGDGHIITNNHVVAQAAKDEGPIVVIDHDRNRYEAEVVGRSPVYDLAVLVVKNGDRLKPAKLGYSARLRVGEPVVAVGSPLGLPDTVTSGIVSYLQRPVTTGSRADESSFINAVQTDAAINPGNSGGPLTNMQGEVVGVNSAIATAGGGGTTGAEAGNIGVGFAIPVEQVRITADQILRTGKAQYPVIGAKVNTGGVPDGRGAEISEIIADSPAEESGLKRGDLITEINGTRVTDGTSLIVAIRTFQPGQTVTFTLDRGSNERKVKVTLDGETG